MDAVVQRVLFLAGGAAVIFTVAYSLYAFWETHTATGRCFAAERTLEQHRFGMDFQSMMNLADKEANRKRSLELCFIENSACFEGFSPDVKAFCNAVAAGGG